MNAAVLLVAVAVVVSGCMDGAYPIGGEKPIRGRVYLNHDISQVPEYYVGVDSSSVNTEGVETAYCLFQNHLIIQQTDHPAIHEKILSLHEAGELEGAYIEFKALTVEQDYPDERMLLTQLIDLRPAPAGDIWADWYCDEKDKGE